MQTQVHSDKTIKVSAGLIRFVDEEAARVLGRFDAKVTRVEFHLSDINNQKSGGADKRCIIEARPAGSQPLSTHATAASVDKSVGVALGKMKRLLTAFFDKKGWSLAPAKKAEVAAVKQSAAKAAPAKKTAPAKNKAPAKKTPAKTAAVMAAKKAGAKKDAVTLVDDAEPPKKRIYQARRKAWPTR